MQKCIWANYLELNTNFLGSEPMHMIPPSESLVWLSSTEIAQYHTVLSVNCHSAKPYFKQFELVNKYALSG